LNTNKDVIRILCFGDSNTWGYIPGSGKRYDSQTRWTGVLQKALGSGFEIIEEGLDGRTLNSDVKRVGKEGRNGSMYLIPCLDTHDPINIVILMLGTNDLKNSVGTSIDEIESVVEKQYVNVIVNRKSRFSNLTPKLLLMSPPIIDLSKMSAIKRKRYSKSRDKNLKLVELYKETAERNNCYFLNSGEIVTCGAGGIHIDAENHKKLAQKLKSEILRIKWK